MSSVDKPLPVAARMEICEEGRLFFKLLLRGNCRQSPALKCWSQELGGVRQVKSCDFIILSVSAGKPLSPREAPLMAENLPEQFLLCSKLNQFTCLITDKKSECVIRRGWGIRKGFTCCDGHPLNKCVSRGLFFRTHTHEIQQFVFKWLWAH